MSQGNLNTQLLNDSNAQIMNVIGHMTGQDYVIPIYIYVGHMTEQDYVIPIYIYIGHMTGQDYIIPIYSVWVCVHKFSVSYT